MTLSLSRTHSRPCTPTGAAKPATLATYFEVWTQRHALSRLDANALKDLGISAASARREATRWFWDLPC